jgi:uncharacterized membrane protein YeaQ/YmgE (transglycosylase-associated protein family)
MGIIIYIIFGALVGWVASEVMNTNGGFIWDIIVGITGAFIGGIIMNIFGQSGVYGFNFYSFLVALLGACILIVLMRRIRG